MVATIESATEVRFGAGAPVQSADLNATSRKSSASSAASTPSDAPSTRPFLPDALGYITVEPDGRDDIGFRDRLRQAIDAVAQAFADREGASAIVDRILASITPSLDEAEAAGQQAAVQLRIASLDVSVSDGGEAFASVRQFALEVSVARGSTVAAQDLSVFATDGSDLGLTNEQIRAGFTTGTYSRTDTGGGEAQSEAARERLAEARSSLERVKATQDALAAFRLGDEGPLRELFEDAPKVAGDRGQVFPGIGALSFR